MVISQDATDKDAADAAESALLASAIAMSDGSLTAEQEEASTRAAKHLSLRRETVLQWLHQTAGAGGWVDWSLSFIQACPVGFPGSVYADERKSPRGRRKYLEVANVLEEVTWVTPCTFKKKRWILAVSRDQASTGAIQIWSRHISKTI